MYRISLDNELKFISSTPVFYFLIPFIFIGGFLTSFLFITGLFLVSPLLILGILLFKNNKFKYFNLADMLSNNIKSIKQDPLAEKNNLIFFSDIMQKFEDDMHLNEVINKKSYVKLRRQNEINNCT